MNELEQLMYEISLVNEDSTAFSVTDVLRMKAIIEQRRQNEVLAELLRLVKEGK